jgi:hypothetical protein
MDDSGALHELGILARCLNRLTAEKYLMILGSTMDIPNDFYERKGAEQSATGKTDA